MEEKRVLYESDGDRLAERQIADVIEGQMDCRLFKMPMRYGLDYMAMRQGKAVAFLEMKSRNCLSTTYETYMIGLHKLMSAQSLTRATGLPCMLVVRWQDKIGMAKLPAEGMPEWWTIANGGTAKRNDARDIEPVVHIPVARFRVMS